MVIPSSQLCDRFTRGPVTGCNWDPFLNSDFRIGNPQTRNIHSAVCWGQRSAGWGTLRKDAEKFHHLSNEKNLGWLGYIGDYTTQLYTDYNKPLQGSLLTIQYNGK